MTSPMPVRGSASVPLTAGPAWSARPSDRVLLPADVLPDQDAMSVTSAPESMALPALAAASPERPARPAARRVSGQTLERLKAALSERDQAILADLHRFSFLTTAQLHVLHFSGHTSDSGAARICRRVLARLRAHRLIEPLQRRIGGVRAGSASFVWRLGPVGDRLLAAATAEHDRPRLRRKEPSLRHLEHCLAVADCALRLITAARQGRLELLRLETEPACWRPYLGAGGSAEILKPDLSAVTATGDFEDHWFIEVDRGTESLPTLLKKCVQYERYRRTGRAQAEAGVFPLVVFVLPDHARQQRLAAALRSARGLDAGLYRLIMAESFADLVARGAA
ncbi:replication-relaxation family protein [Kineococcus glutinatus]|uniref:Protein involved in plasmid replication-relaxation n=1 Tax=Kineococcus glutinatus TaxID=1070872 RepID=A0ABP9HER9_9ACTN